jgi:plasmid stabilization system protein ParE
MRVLYELTPQALDDLYEIWLYIAEDKVTAADRVEAAILAACRRLDRFPGLGTERAGVVSEPIRLWPVPRYSNYCIIYLPDTKPLRIVRILHGARDIGAILSSRS